MLSSAAFLFCGAVAATYSLTALSAAPMPFVSASVSKGRKMDMHLSKVAIPPIWPRTGPIPRRPATREWQPLGSGPTTTIGWFTRTADLRFDAGMPELTRRRYKERPDCWHVFYGDVHVGTIARRTGAPIEKDPWNGVLASTRDGKRKLKRD